LLVALRNRGVTFPRADASAPRVATLVARHQRYWTTTLYHGPLRHTNMCSDVCAIIAEYIPVALPQ